MRNDRIARRNYQNQREMMKFSFANKSFNAVGWPWLLTVWALAAAPSRADNFVQYSTYPVGVGPNNVATADVNHDGKLDLICANDGLNFTGTNTLTVLTNNGRGGFGYNATYSVGYGPFVLAADLRNLGRPDLVTANFATNTVTVLTNDGSGNFSLSGTYTVGDGPFNVAAADVNGDGWRDLITANDGGNGNTITVLTNNGSGQFGFNATYTVGHLPFVYAVKLRGNGPPDLVTANYGDNTLTVLTNNGQGGFAFSTNYNVGAGPINLAAADLNGDGKIDLVCANNATDTLTVLTNNGDGTFTAQPELTVGPGPYVAVADVNGDGWPDLVSADYNDATLIVLTNDGDGNFSYYDTFPVQNSPVSVTAADLNNDNRPELISANYGDNSVTVRMETPLLSLALSNNSTAVAWSPNWTNYFLQTASSLGVGSVWTNVPNPLSTNLLTLPADAGNHFYRLRHP